jgi:hypothetical protein
VPTRTAIRRTIAIASHDGSHLLYTGDDWKAWLDRIPESRRDRISEELAGEAKLISLAKQGTGK